MTRLGAHLHLAFSVGAVGGFAFGCREALLTVDANAFVQPGQYLFAYLAIPILSCMALSILLLLPCALAATILRPAPSFTFYVSVLTFAGTASITVPWVTAAVTQLADVGLLLGFGATLLLWSVAVTLAAGAAAIVAAAATWYASRVDHPLRYATWSVAALTPLLLWPVLRFVSSDWKWAAATHEAPGVSAAPSSSPDVVLISIDTLRADHLGSYGSRDALTPRMDRLAAEGVVFEHTITSSPWTLPAMASLFTGLYPRHHGAGTITNRRDPLGRAALPAGAWTLAGTLHERGYRTHAVVTNPYLALRYGLGQGFDTYENVTIESEAFLAMATTTAVRLLNGILPDLVAGDRGDTVSRRAERWLTRVEPDRPFFLWVHYVDPHPPYSRAGANRHKSFRTDSLFAPVSSDAQHFTLTSPDVARLRSGEIRLSAEQKAAVHALYRAEVASVDSAVGAVLEALDRVGLRERTLVICVADHGEEFWEHGGVEHGHTVYEELVRVPLLMRWPGHLPAGVRIAPVVRLTDVAPTILDLLSMPAPAVTDGETLLPLLQGGAAAPRIALTENMLFAEERVGLRTPHHKYVRWDNGKEELYDLEHDPQERRDLAGTSTLIDPLRQLYAQLDQRPLTPPANSAAPRLDTAAVEAMRALGYLH